MFRSRRTWWMPSGTTQNYRWLRVTAVIVIIVGTFHVLERFSTFRWALSMKFSPTAFPNMAASEQECFDGKTWLWSEGGSAGGPEPNRALSYSRQSLWDHRKEWKKLGRGWEGEAYVYGKTVVKAFHEDHGPFRNCIANNPQVTDGRWPPEIQASLLLGGRVEADEIANDAFFLPVNDYFLSPATEDQDERWHLVMPLARHGTMKKLAKNLRKSGVRYTAKDVDIMFRPSYNHILAALNEMHTTHRLCHDDLKLGNIFVMPPSSSTTIESPELKDLTHWILADLGQVREVDHPFHDDILWKNYVNNLPDCRANDVFRLTKIYIDFLRRAVDDIDQFNREFLECSEPWSRLFWSVSDEVEEGGYPTATWVLDRSRNEDDASTSASMMKSHWPTGIYTSISKFIMGWESTIAAETHEVLNVLNTEATARAWGITALLGVPGPTCHSQRNL